MTSEHETKEKLLSPNQVAEILQCTTMHVRNLYMHGVLPYFKLSKKVIRIKESDLNKYIEDHRA